MDSVIDVCLFYFSYEPRLLIVFFFVSAASDGAENRRLGVRENSEFDATGETTGREAGCQGALADLGVYSTLQTGVRRINQRLLYVLGRASAAYRNAICCGANLGAIFTSGCPRNENG